MVPLSTLVKVTKMSGPNFVTRFNLYNAAEMMGAPRPATARARRSRRSRR
jgi:hydrophobic/amphiphilic exporter-1 (mainly G- bacteria), HAE1 family